MKGQNRLQFYGFSPGFSPPFFGVSWQPPETERKIAKSVVNFLEDRRVLYNPTELELPQHCISSVVEIRHFLTENIAELDQDSELAKNLKMMRAACGLDIEKDLASILPASDM